MSWAFIEFVNNKTSSLNFSSVKNYEIGLSILHKNFKIQVANMYSQVKLTNIIHEKTT